MKSKSDWLNSFVEKNAWSILALLVFMAVFYTSITSAVEAQDTRIERLENAIVDLVENQKAVIILQTQHENTEEDLAEIKSDLKDIKKNLGLAP